MKDQKKVPITIIAGFLGVGKTTLLNHILSSRKERRLAVIVNDFGEINIDGRLVKTVDENIIELSNGCICCSIRANFYDTVMRLLQSEHAPEHIIVECSGVSDPETLITTFMSPMLRPLVKVDGIITVVDAKNAMFFYQMFPSLVEQQIKLSNFIVLNKIDRIPENDKEDVKAWISQWRPQICIMEAVNADVPIELLLGFSDININLEGQEVEHVNHKDMFDSYSYRTEKIFSKDALNEWKEQLPPDILRAKGILNLGNDDGTCRFNLVGSWSGFDEVKDSDEINMSELVFIGKKGWQQDYDIEKSLESCLQLNR